MGTVSIKLPPVPAHVRTARLVAATMARRAGVGESLLDEIRLAVGEACARAVHLHAALDKPVPITVEMTDGDCFEVVVQDVVPPTEPTGDAGVSMPAGGPGWLFNADPAALGLAILAAVVDDVRIEPGAQGGSRVSMRWPITEAVTLPAPA